MQSYEESKQEGNHMKMKSQKKMIYCEIGLRASALVTSLAATCVAFTSNQTAIIFGIQMDAKYSYSSAFKFFAFATAIASVCSLVSLGLTLILRKIGSSKANYHFLFFMHDLVVMSVLLAGCAAATAIGYVAEYGNDHAGWMPICDHFPRYCHKSTAAVVLGYFSFIFFFFLTIIGATKSTRTPHFQLSPQI